MSIKKHFLLTVGRDGTHHYGARFLNYFFQNKNDVLVDILHVTYRPDSAGYASAAGNAASADRISSLLQEAARKLTDFGFPDENIKTDSRLSSISTVKDIIVYGRKGLYDSLILGRRGLTMLESLIQDSVSSKILDEQCDMPIWICREPEPHKKHLLLCTDGSQQSLDSADHVGFVMGAAPENNITVLHVRPANSTGNEQEILDSTVARIIDNNIARERISTLVLESGNAARSILNYARENNYAAIAMGRKCRTKPRGLSRFFVGSVSSEVLNNLENSSLWICR